MSSSREANQAVERFLAKYDAPIARETKKAVTLLRKRFPGASVAVYDNSNALVFAFGTGVRRGDFLFSIAAYPRYVTLFLMGGASLDDPTGLLEGSGSTIRHVKLLEGAVMLERPAIKRLLAQAVGRTDPPLSRTGGTLEVRSVSKTQRPRQVSAARSTTARSSRPRP